MGPASAKTDHLAGNGVCCPSSPVVVAVDEATTVPADSDDQLHATAVELASTIGRGESDEEDGVHGKHEEYEYYDDEYDEDASPDGGWGWAVLAGVMLVNFTHIGHFKSFAVYVEPLMRLFDASPARVAFIVSFVFLGFSYSAPIASMLAQRIGPRALSLTASVVACVSLALSSLATSLEFLYVTLGLMAGIAAVCSFNPGVLMIARYFVKRRGLANGLCMAGNALGGILLPLVTEMLISSYGFRGGILVMGSILLNGCVGAMLWQPVSWHFKKSAAMSTTKSEMRVSDSGIDTCCDEPSQAAEDGVASPNEGPSSLAFDDEEIPWIEAAERNDLLRGPALTRKPSTKSAVSATNSPAARKPKAFESPFRGRRYRAGSLTSSQTIRWYQPLSNGHVKRTTSTDSVTSSLKYLSTCDLSPAAAANVAALVGTSQVTSPTQDVESGMNESTVSSKRPAREADDRLKMIDTELLRNPVFWIIAFSQVCWVFGYPGTQLFLPLRATLLGYSQQQAASLLSALALADFFGRIFCAWLSDFKFCSRLYWCVGGMFFSGIFSLVLPLATDYFSLVAIAVGFGFSAGAYLGLIVARFSDVFGGEKVSMVHGMVCVFSGISGVGGPPLLGYILQRTQSYVLCQSILATVLMLGAIVCLLEPWAAKRHQEAETTTKYTPE